MSTNLHAASSQWANRPADERFWTLRDMRMACEVARANSIGARVPFNTLKVSYDDDDLTIRGNVGTPARFTHYAFGQFCGAVGAPAGYLRELPSHVAADALYNRTILASIARTAHNDDFRLRVVPEQSVDAELVGRSARFAVQREMHTLSPELDRWLGFHTDAYGRPR